MVEIGEDVVLTVNRKVTKGNKEIGFTGSYEENDHIIEVNVFYWNKIKI